jgi:hypothetical protein
VLVTDNHPGGQQTYRVIKKTSRPVHPAGDDQNEYLHSSPLKKSIPQIGKRCLCAGLPGSLQCGPDRILPDRTGLYRVKV